MKLYAQKEGIGIGIDLGTTRSAVAILSENNVPSIIPIPQNGRTMPSTVAFDEETGRVWVGQEACDRQNKAGVFRNVKRILGTGGKLTNSVAKAVPFLVLNSEGKTYKKNSLLNQIHDAQAYPTLLKFPHNSTRFSPEVISAHVLQVLVKAAEDATGEKVTRAVIGVPAYFHDEQRAATLRAAEMAGLSRVKLLREPEAAALAYGIGKDQISSDYDDELVLVFDLGGGTFDVSILLVGGGVTEVLCTSGNSQLGGADLDNRVADHCWKVLSHHIASLKPSAWSDEAKNGIVRASEQIRIALSNAKRVELALPVSQEDWCSVLTGREVLLPLGNDENYTETGILDGSHVHCCLTRRTLEKVCDEELQALLRPIREVAIVAGALLPGDANPTAVEAAREMEEQFIENRDMAFADFYSEDEQEAAKVTKDTDSQDSQLLLAVQDMDMKAAKRAQQKGRKKARQIAKEERKYREEKRKIETNNPSSNIDRVKVRDGISGRPISRVVLVGGTTRMPAIGRLIAALTGVVPQRTVNPDEAVALGCAAKVGVLDGIEGMGTVLNPMQAAILKAVARQQGMQDDFDDDFDFDDETEALAVE